MRLFRSNLHDMFRRGSRSLALRALLLGDLVLISISLGREAVRLFIPEYTGLITSSFFSINIDNGLAELFQYPKEAGAAIFAFLIWVRQRALVWLILSLLFAYLLADDAFQIHESSGRLLVSLLDSDRIAGITTQDVGELAATCTVFAVFAIWIIGQWSRLDMNTQPAVSMVLALVGLLACLGVGLDVLMTSFWFFDESQDQGWRHAFKEVVTHIEDGGEMLVVSVIVWFVGNVYVSLPAEQRYRATAPASSVNAARGEDYRGSRRRAYGTAGRQP